MRTKIKWMILLGIFLLQININANSQELPKKKSDWIQFETYQFSGNSSSYTFDGDMHFKRNGVEVDIKNDVVVFKKNAYFKTNALLVKLEQAKLIISVKKKIKGVKYTADKVIEKDGKLHLKGNVSLTLSKKNTFKANEIILDQTN